MKIVAETTLSFVKMFAKVVLIDGVLYHPNLLCGGSIFGDALKMQSSCCRCVNPANLSHLCKWGYGGAAGCGLVYALSNLMGWWFV